MAEPAQPRIPTVSLAAARELRARADRVTERAALSGTPRSRFLREERRRLSARMLPALGTLAAATGAAAAADVFREPPVPREVLLAQGVTASVLEGATMLLNTGPAGVTLVPKSAWARRAGLKAAADLNAVPPLGIEGIEVTDNAVERDGVTVFGALGVGGLKMKIHKTCVARLFERNDLILDAETIAEVAAELGK